MKKRVIECGIPRIYVSNNELYYDVDVVNVHPTEIIIHENLLISASKVDSKGASLEHQIDDVGPACLFTLSPREKITCGNRFYLREGATHISLEATIVIDEPLCGVNLALITCSVNVECGSGKIENVTFAD